MDVSRISGSRSEASSSWSGLDARAPYGRVCDTVGRQPWSVPRLRLYPRLRLPERGHGQQGDIVMHILFPSALYLALSASLPAREQTAVPAPRSGLLTTAYTSRAVGLVEAEGRRATRSN